MSAFAPMGYVRSSRSDPIPFARLDSGEFPMEGPSVARRMCPDKRTMSKGLTVCVCVCVCVGSNARLGA